MTATHASKHAVGRVLERHVDVRDDVRVIGVDNSPFCDFFVVPLSSVSQEEFRRGELAVETLFNAVEGHAVQSITV